MTGKQLRRGKISGTVFQRSVLKYLRNSREDVITGPGIGMDGSVIDLSGDLLVTASSAVAHNIPDKVFFGINRAVNHLAALKAKPVGITVHILAGETFEEGKLQDIMKRVQEVCDGFQMTVLGSHTEITEAVKDVIITFTAEGCRERTKKEPVPSDQAAVMVTGYVGLEGTAILAQLKETELSGYYCRDLIRDAKNFKNMVGVRNVSEILAEKQVIMHDLAQGGFLSALWDMGIRTDKGMTIDMRAVPIRQETVEICEFLSLNPYELLSGGAMMVITDDEEGVRTCLEENGIPVSVIGYLNSGNDRLLKFGETTGFLNRPSADEIFKIV